MSRIAFLTGGLGKGGQENQLLLLLESLQINSYDIVVINWSGISDEANLIRLRYLDNLSYHDLGGKNALSKFKIISRIYSKCDRIVCFTSYLNMYSHILSSIVGKKSFGAARIEISYELKRVIGWINLLLVPRIISNSNSALIELRKRSLFKNHYYLNNRIKLIKNSPIDEQDWFSISIGTVNHRKRLDLIIELGEYRVSKGLPFSHIHLGEGPLRQELQEKLINRSLDFKFLGNVSNVFSYLKKSSFIIHVSESEGTPNVLLEALAVGIKVLCTDSGDIAELLIEERNGYVLDQWDVNEFSNNYTKLLSDNDVASLPKNYRFNAKPSYADDFLKIVL